MLFLWWDQSFIYMQYIIFVIAVMYVLLYDMGPHYNWNNQINSRWNHIITEITELTPVYL